MKWSGSELDLLKHLWSRGESAAYIGKQLHRTRNAVIGKLFRGKLLGTQPVRAVPTPGRPAKPPKSLRLLSETPPRKPVPLPDPVPEPVREPVQAKRGPRRGKFTILDLGPRRCRWPFGDPRERDFWFCGAGTALGCVYCDEHMQLAFDRRPVTPHGRARLGSA